ncbi:uncharacterized protein LOC126586612 [Malus sylvestris]|uniref:uncharacterized protein LOC126586612 n=1 Tax=Malus sylvestris TaxID=3752 RepID=UPI0021ABF48F|nr:uncharacterized protein LOC126586612 [Malus sylvestris]
MASAILFPLALKSGGFPLEASDYSAIFGLPWTSLHFKLLFGLGIRGFQRKNGSQKKTCILFLPPCILALPIFDCSSFCGSKAHYFACDSFYQTGGPSSGISSIGCWTNYFAAPS